jgi:hypothetical protein
LAYVWLLKWWKHHGLPNAVRHPRPSTKLANQFSQSRDRLPNMKPRPVKLRNGGRGCARFHRRCRFAERHYFRTAPQPNRLLVGFNQRFYRSLPEQWSFQRVCTGISGLVVSNGAEETHRQARHTRCSCRVSDAQIESDLSDHNFITLHPVEPENLYRLTPLPHKTEPIILNPYEPRPNFNIGGKRPDICGCGYYKT